MLYLLKNIVMRAYDCTNGVIVRAKTEEEARHLASKVRGDEGREVWLNEKYSTIEIIKSRGASEVILRDFRAG